MKVPVAVYGGSFDPVHNGHLELVRYLVKTKVTTDVILLPSFAPPHKAGKQGQASFRHRVHMLRLGLRTLEAEVKSQTRISLLEKSLPVPGYTYHTLKHMKTLCNKDFAFVIGADMYNYLPKWKYYEKLIEEYRFIVLQRKEEPLKKSITFKKPPVVLDNPAWNVSSTMLKQAMAKHQYSLVEELLPAPVFNYIMNRGIY